MNDLINRFTVYLLNYILTISAFITLDSNLTLRIILHGMYK